MNEKYTASPTRCQGPEKLFRNLADTLIEAIQNVFDRLDPTPSRPADLCQIKGINKDLASKLFKGMNQTDSLVALYYLPGSEALHTFMRAVNRRMLNRSVTDKLKHAIKEYRDLVSLLPDGQVSLKTMISARSAELRSRYLHENRQIVYRGLANIKGVAADTQFTTWIILPDTRSSRLNLVNLQGWDGLRRFLPEKRSFSWITGIPGQSAFQKTLDETDLCNTNSIYSSSDSVTPDQLSVSHQGNFTRFKLAIDSFPLFSEHHLLTLGYFPQHINPWRSETSPAVDFSAPISVPVKTLIMDLLVHESIWSRQIPEISCTDSQLTELAHYDSGNSLPLTETFQQLPTEINELSLPCLSEYSTLLHNIGERLQTSCAFLRCYRSVVHYPISGSTISASFTMDSEPPGKHSIQPSLFQI